MNLMGWTSVGWLAPDSERRLGGGPEALRRWKWYRRDDVFVCTNDDEVLAVLANALERMEA